MTKSKYVLDETADMLISNAHCADLSGKFTVLYLAQSQVLLYPTDPLGELVEERIRLLYLPKSNRQPDRLFNPEYHADLQTSGGKRMEIAGQSVQPVAQEDRELEHPLATDDPDAQAGKGAGVPAQPEPPARDYITSMD